MWAELLGVVSVGLYVLKYHLAGYTAAAADYVPVLFGVGAVVLHLAMVAAPECAVGAPATQLSALLVSLAGTIYDAFGGGHRGAQATAAGLVHVLLAGVRGDARGECASALGVCMLVGLAAVVCFHTPSPRPAGRVTAVTGVVVVLCLPRATPYEVLLLLAVACAPLDPRGSYAFAAVATVAAAANPVEPFAAVLVGCALAAFAATPPP